MKSLFFSAILLVTATAFAQEYVPPAPVPMTAPHACHAVQTMPMLAPSVCSPAAATPMFIPAPPTCSQSQSLTRYQNEGLAESIIGTNSEVVVELKRRHRIEELACALGQRMKEHRTERKERRATKVTCTTATAATTCSTCQQVQSMPAPMAAPCGPVLAAPSPCPSCH